MRLAYRHPNPNRNPTPSAGRPLTVTLPLAQEGLHLVGLPRRLERVVLTAHRQRVPGHAPPRLVLQLRRACEPHPPLHAPCIRRGLDVGGNGLGLGPG